MGRLSRRTFLRVVSSTAAGAILAACGGSAAPAVNESGASSGSSTAAANQGSSGAQANAPAQSAGAAGTITLALPTYTDETKPLLEQEIIPAFQQANSGVQVKINYTSWERYNEEMTTAFAGGVTPDVFMGGAVWTPQMVQRNWVLPLDQYVSATSKEWNWDDFFPALRQDVTVDGKIYAVPAYIDIRPFWYRKDYLSEAGISAPPTTTDELREVARALTQRNGDTITREGFHFSSPGGWQNDLQAYMIFMHKWGGQFLSDDLSKCALTEEPAVKALEYVYQLIVEDKVQPYPGFEAQGNLVPISMGSAATTVAGADIERNAKKFAPDQVDQLVATLPLKGEKQATHVWVNKFFISRLSKNQDTAWAFLQHLTSPETLAKYNASAGLVPPRESLGNADFVTPNVKVAIESTQYAVPYPAHWKLLEMFRPFATNLESCLRGQLSPADTMKQTCEAVNKILAAG